LFFGTVPDFVPTPRLLCLPHRRPNIIVIQVNVVQGGTQIGVPRPFLKREGVHRFCPSCQAGVRKVVDHERRHAAQFQCSLMLLFRVKLSMWPLFVVEGKTQLLTLLVSSAFLGLPTLVRTLVRAAAMPCACPLEDFHGALPYDLPTEPMAFFRPQAAVD
jgi:hypothetical protein